MIKDMFGNNFKNNYQNSVFKNDLLVIIVKLL